jgi:glutathione synthase/RimK-type ligase-like ATP-grasp enzyme
MPQPKIYILHENKEWIQPLLQALEEMELPHEEWFLDQGMVDLQQLPPEGIFYNRMSASSHTRGHRYAVEFTAPVLAWLEQHGRRVINGRRALQLEVRKFEQYLALQSHDIPTPHTIAAVGREEVLEAARSMNKEPFILKPNRGGKGAGVQLFENITALEDFLDTANTEFSLDGVSLVQEYIPPVDGSIVRTEFIGGEFYYAVRVDASDGFQLCPADNCSPGDEFCPTSVKPSEGPEKFSLIKDYDNPDIPKYERFLADNGIDIAGIEYVKDESGNRYVYDVNTNTNYNREAERRAGDQQKGMWEIARFLGAELNKQENAGSVLQKVSG